MMFRRFCWFGAGLVLLAGTASSQQTTSEEDFVRSGPGAIVCGSLYRVEMRLGSPESRRKAKTAADGQVKLVQSRTGVAPAEAERVVAERTAYVEAGLKDGKITEDERIDATRLCDEVNNHTVMQGALYTSTSELARKHKLPPQPAVRDGDAYFTGVDAIETCAAIYLYEALISRDPRAKDRAKAAGDAVAARLPEASGLPAEETNKSLAVRVERLGLADREGRISHVKRLEIIGICDKHYGHSVGVPLPEIAPPPLTLAEVETCQSDLEAAGDLYQRLTKQFLPDDTLLTRQKKAGRVCFEMRNAHRKARYARCPADVMANLTTLKEGSEQLVDMVSPTGKNNIGCAVY